MSQYIINSGTTSNGLILNPDDILYVSSGGVANSTTVNSGGTMVISNGGVVDDLVINRGAQLYIYDGTASGDVVFSDGAYVYMNGGKLSGQIYIDSNVYVFAYNNTTIDFDISNLEPGAAARINDLSPFSSFNYTLTVSDTQTGGNYILAENAGGFSNQITIQNTSGQTLGELSVGQEITINGICYELDLTGGALSFVEAVSGVSISNQTLNISSGEVYSDIRINSNGRINVSNGGEVDGAKVNLDGSLYVFSGGVANSTTVNQNGNLTVSSGGVASKTTVNVGGHLYVEEGGVANGVYSFSSGLVTVSSGGSMLNAVLSGSIQVMAAEVQLGGYASNVDILDGLDMYVSGYITDVDLYAYDRNDPSDLYIYSGGVAENVRAGNLANFRINSGGRANNITLSDNGGWGLSISNGGIVSNTTVGSGGRGIVSSGGKLTGRTAIDQEAFFSVDSGAIIDFDLSETTPEAPARINDLSRVSGWSNAIYTLTISDTQAAGIYTLAGNVEGFNKTITVKNTSGIQIGSLSVGENLKDNNVLYSLVFNDSTQELNLIYNYFEIYSEQTIDNETVTVSDLEIYSSPVVSNNGKMIITSGGIANNASVSSGGSVVISSGGEAHNTTLDNNGSMYVYGVASNVTVNAGGWFVVQSDGMLTGQMTIAENGAYVSAAPGAIINFDLSSISPGADTRINSLSNITGWGDAIYTLTVPVSTLPTAGTYSLAEDAASFDETITIQNTLGESLGTITVGNTVSIRGRVYTLNLEAMSQQTVDK